MTFPFTIRPYWLLFGVTCLVGCAAKRQPEWTPKPLVRWEDLSTEPMPLADDGYLLLCEGATKGLFPATIGVTRLTIDEDAAGRVAALRTDPRNEFLQWNSAFDDKFAISEVFPVSQFDLGGGEAGPQQVLAALHAFHARLGLIYAVNEPRNGESEIIAALYEVKTGRPLASIHAHALSLAPTAEERKQRGASLWTTDSRALVRAKFENIVYACMDELIAKDQPAPIEDSSGWRPVVPIRPVEWPPARDAPTRPQDQTKRGS